MSEIVTADLMFILDPHRLLLLLAGLEAGVYKQILLPDTFQFIELWGPKYIPPIRWHIFDCRENINENASRFYGFPDKSAITPDNFIAAMRLLQFAYFKGMVEPFSTEKLTRTGLKILNTDKHYPDMYPRTLPNGSRLTIGVDMGGATLEALVALNVERV
jgi:hypothetical protein